MINEKYIQKYMRMAKQVGEDSNPCYSRKIGTIIVEPETNRVLSIGLNGPPRGTPHTDSEEYLRDVFWPQLTREEKEIAMAKVMAEAPLKRHDDSEKDHFVRYMKDCKRCPRRIIGARSGQRLDGCSCSHSEINSIVNAGQSVYGAEMFCWCSVPCIDCTKYIINAGISKVTCLYNNGPDYSPQSRWLFDKAGLPLEFRDQDTLEIVK